MCIFRCCLGRKEGWSVPLVYVLTCDRKRTTYDQIFDALLKVEPKLNPTDITVDFEIGVIKSLSKHFPQAAIHGCFFHFTQNVWRHIQTNGLQVPYTNDEDIAFELRLLIALAFVPEANVIEAYDQLLTTGFYAEENENEYKQQIQILLNYFQSTYLFAIDRTGKRKDPLFPIKIWNVYETTLNGKKIFELNFKRNLN